MLQDTQLKDRQLCTRTSQTEEGSSIAAGIKTIFRYDLSVDLSLHSIVQPLCAVILVVCTRVFVHPFTQTECHKFADGQ